jgi:hypothetical protein
MAKATSSKYTLESIVSSCDYNAQQTEEVHNFQFSTLTHSDDDQFRAKKTECGFATDKILRLQKTTETDGKYT